MQTHQPTEHEPYPLGKPGQMATYHHESEDSLPDTRCEDPDCGNRLG